MSPAILLCLEAGSRHRSTGVVPATAPRAEVRRLEPRLGGGISRLVWLWCLMVGLGGALPATAAAQIDRLPHSVATAVAESDLSPDLADKAPARLDRLPHPTDTLALQPVSIWSGGDAAVEPTSPLSPSGSLDLAVAHAVRRSGVQDSRMIRVTADVAGFAAVPGTAILAAALYGIGEVRDRPNLSDVGLHTGEALVVAAGFTLVGKVAAGRARPYQSPEDPGDFHWLRGLQGNDFQSFPSFHTAAAFAAATAISADPRTRATPARGWIIPATYATAVLSGVSRIYQDKHWTSDVLVGALVGSLSGLAVSQYAN